MTLEAVIFDLFGTLVPKWPSALACEVRRGLCDTLQVDSEAFLRAFRRTDLAREIGRVTFEQGLQRAAEACNAADLQRIERATKHWLRFVRERVALREEVPELLQGCRERGLRIGLLSDCNDDVPRIFRELTVASRFDTLGFSCELGVKKPHRRAYLQVCRGLGVDPRRCAFVGDGGSRELRGARRAGMTAIFFRHAREIEQEGLPAGARDWQGLTIERLTALWSCLLDPRANA